jgi:hypothetical protein
MNGEPWTSARLLARAFADREAYLQRLAEEIRDDYLKDLHTLFPSRAAWQKTYAGRGLVAYEVSQLRTILHQIFPEIQVAVRQEDNTQISVLIHLWSTSGI